MAFNPDRAIFLAEALLGQKLADLEKMINHIHIHTGTRPTKILIPRMKFFNIPTEFYDGEQVALFIPDKIPPTTNGEKNEP